MNGVHPLYVHVCVFMHASERACMCVCVCVSVRAHMCMSSSTSYVLIRCVVLKMHNRFALAGKTFLLSTAVLMNVSLQNAT